MVLAGLGGAGTALLVVVGVVPLPDLDRVLEDAARTLGTWAYPAVAGFAFLETGAFVGLAVPGETAVVVGGVVAARGEVEIVPLIAVVWMAAAAGDAASFLLGRRLGRPFLDRHGTRLHLGPKRRERVERFYSEHGGKAVLIGRFAGVVRAVSPFLAGASGLALRRFLPWSAAGALLWSAAFLLVGYAFSESFAQAGDTAARVALGVALVAALAYLTAAGIRSGRLRRRGRTHQAKRQERTEGSHTAAQQRPGHDVEWKVDAQVDARQRHRGRDGERERTQARAEDGHGGGGRESGGAVARREGGVAGDRDHRAEAGVGHGRAFAGEHLLENVGHERGEARGASRGQEGHRHAPAPEVGAEPEPHQQRPLHPPGRQHHEHRGKPGVLEGRSGLDERAVEVEQITHDPGRTDASRTDRLVLAVNGRASGISDPRAYAGELASILEELGAPAEVVVTESEETLWQVLRSAASAGRRVVLAGGDGTLHAAANAPLRDLPELALVPAGRANNIARALGIPTARAGALSVAAGARARPLDALRVVTPDRFVYALEAVSAGFHAEARAGYQGDNSADLRQGIRALVLAILRYAPYRVRIEADPPAPASARVLSFRSRGAAQVFFSNLPYFGFGFEVDPGADPADGRFEVITLEARGRARLLRLLAAARRGRHLGRRGVRRVAARRARLREAMPLVADSVPLGTTVATVSVEPGRLRVASPRLGVAA
jgi:membrane protein DedA with SNARE-associated domain/diacylglycerol kinase family enzyme